SSQIDHRLRNKKRFNHQNRTLGVVQRGATDTRPPRQDHLPPRRIDRSRGGRAGATPLEDAVIPKQRLVRVGHRTIGFILWADTDRFRRSFSPGSVRSSRGSAPPTAGSWRSAGRHPSPPTGYGVRSSPAHCLRPERPIRRRGEQHAGSCPCLFLRTCERLDRKLDLVHMIQTFRIFRKSFLTITVLSFHPRNEEIS